MRAAARLVRLGQQFRSTIFFRMGARTANLRSILSLLSLCAVMGTTLDVEASGDDEEEAVRAVAQAFADPDLDALLPDDGGAPPEPGGRAFLHF